MQWQRDNVCRALLDVDIAWWFGPAFEAQNGTGPLRVRDKLADRQIEGKAHKFEPAAAENGVAEIEPLQAIHAGE
jgi:hypothetical protein